MHLREQNINHSIESDAVARKQRCVIVEPTRFRSSFLFHCCIDDVASAGYEASADQLLSLENWLNKFKFTRPVILYDHFTA